METMYAPQNNSPKATLVSAINATATTITVDDASIFLEAPNVLTIGTGEDAELVQYTNITGNILTVVRGFNGTTAKSWNAGIYLYRAITAQDVSALQANVAEVDTALTAHADNTTIHVTAEDKQKWNNPPEAPVQSVFGRTGAVVAETGDYTPEQVGAAPAIHASQHASTGDDPITPASIGAASETHSETHNQGGSDPISLLGIGAAVNPNLLINADFRDPANPTGQTSWQAADYQYIDALSPWVLSINGLPSMTLHEGYATFTGNDSYIGQRVLGLEAGETYTASVLLQDGTFVSGSGSYAGSSTPVVLASGEDTAGNPLKLTVLNSSSWISAFVVENEPLNSSASSVNVVALKLEKGTHQTLAYEDNGTWKLYEAPNRAKQMAMLPMFGSTPTSQDHSLLSYPRRTHVGQYDDASENLAKPWFKFAHLSFPDGHTDTFIVFRVFNGYDSNDGSTENGVLIAHIRNGAGGAISGSPDFVWEYANSGIDPSMFVMCYKDKTDTDPVYAELWCKRDTGWDECNFEVIFESKNHVTPWQQDWILDGGQSTKGGEASLPSDMTQLVSTINMLKGVNPSVTSISLPAASWTGDASPYSQVITVSGITNNSKIDLQPDATIISQLITDTVAGLYIVNDNTTVTAYAVNAKPTIDLTIQATITEVQS